MSRIIKFRVWSYEDEEYRTDCNLKQLFNSKTGAPSTIYNDEGDRFDIEQYTGLKDKNGKEIYEGDIVRRVCQIGYDMDDKRVEYPVSCPPVLIEWDEAGCGWSYFLNGCGLCRKMGWAAPEEVEVIGNVHENPELIGNEK